MSVGPTRSALDPEKGNELCNPAPAAIESRLVSSGWRSHQHQGETPGSQERIVSRATPNSTDRTVELTGTPTHQTNFSLICEALRANPEGLRTQDILKWLEKSRPEIFVDRPRDKFKASLHATLSAQANKKDPKLWRYEVEGSKQPGFVWTLSSNSTMAHNPIAAAGVCTGSEGQETRPNEREILNHSTARIPSADNLEKEGNLSTRVDKVEEEARGSAPERIRRQTSHIALHQEQELAPSSGIADHTACDSVNVRKSLGSSLNGNENDHVQDLYYGRLVMQIHGLRKQRADTIEDMKSKDIHPTVEQLKRELAELQVHAEEQERIAKQARLQAEAAREVMEAAIARQDELVLAKRKLESLDKELQESRKRLKIDDDL